MLSWCVCVCVRFRWYTTDDGEEVAEERAMWEDAGELELLFRMFRKAESELCGEE